MKKCAAALVAAVLLILPAAAVSGAQAVKILIPSATCGTRIAGVEECRLEDYLKRAVDLALREVGL